MASGFADIDGRRLSYDTSGSGAAVVFIPGFTLDMRMWDAQAEVVARRRRVVRYDLPGAGRSSPPTGSYAYHDDLAALLDHLAIRRAHLVGLSLGAAIAVDVALEYPERTRSLTLVGTSALGGYPWPAELDAWFDAISDAARVDLDAAKERWLSTGWFAPALRRPAVAHALRAIVAGYSGWHFANRNPVRRPKPPADARLDEISVPTLVVVGALDLPFYNVPLAEHLAASIAGARKLVLDDVGHMANMEDPERFNAALLSFLDDVEAQFGT
jgi:3-oxoadipate enol-lactonase